MDFKYDVIVIGAGHAGCEAAAAAANLGSKTCLITMDMNKIGQMSCNPAVGGIAKGQIVREIDALGGYMGLVTDRTAIQFRMLNRSKGPAMWSPRAQCDRGKFIWAWREILENIPNLHIWQDTVDELLVENGKVTGVSTCWGVTFQAEDVEYGRSAVELHHAGLYFASFLDAFTSDDKRCVDFFQCLSAMAFVDASVVGSNDEDTVLVNACIFCGLDDFTHITIQFGQVGIISR